MTPAITRWLVGGIVALVLLTPSDAHARGLVIVTGGDTIVPLGRGETLPRTRPTAPLPPGYRPSGPTVSVNIGYKYQYFGVFWINVWTSGGTYCEYEGDAYTPISSAEAARALGKSEADLTLPFAYRYPLGWFIFGPLLLIWALVSIVARVRRSQRANPPNAGPDRRTKRAILVLVAVGLLAVAGGVWLVTQSGSSTPASGQAPAPPTPEQVAENEAAEFVMQQGGRFVRDESLPGKPVVEVYLEQSRITDSDLKRLTPLKNLTRLNLPRITDETAAELRKIGLLYAIGPAYREGGVRAKSADEVTTFGFCLTQMTDAGLKELAVFPNLNNIVLEREKITDDTLAELRKINLLHALCYANGGGEGGRRPKRPEDVTHLRLFLSRVTDAGLKDIATLPNLVSLDLSHTQVTGTGLKDLTPLTKLTQLNLFRTKVLGGAALKDLAPLTSLTDLDVENKQITDTTLAELRKINLLHALRVVECKGNQQPQGPQDIVSINLTGTWVTNAGLQELADCKNLTGLDLTYTRVTAAGLQHLAPLKELNELNLEDEKLTDETLAELRKIGLLHALKQARAKDGKRPLAAAGVDSISLFGEMVTDVGLMEFTQFKNLTHLTLTRTNVTASGVRKFQQALPNCKIVKH